MLPDIVLDERGDDGVEEVELERDEGVGGR